MQNPPLGLFGRPDVLPLEYRIRSMMTRQSGRALPGLGSDSIPLLALRAFLGSAT